MSNTKYLGPYKKIDKFPAASAGAAADIFPVLQSGDSQIKKMTLAQLATYIEAGGGMEDLVITGATPTVILKDSDCTDSDNNFVLAVNATDTGTGAEDIDWSISSQVAGTVTAHLSYDASGDELTVAPADVKMGAALDLGASGTAGGLDIFPGTEAKGKFTLSCTDQDGDTAVGFKPAAMGQATVISIPDPGAATANVVLTDQANDGAVCTASATELSQLDGTTLTAGSIFADAATTEGAGITGDAATCEHSVTKIGGLFKTEILIDLTGLESKDTANDIIGDSGGGAAHIGQITAARNGTIFAGKIECLEAPAGGDDDIDLYSATEDTGAYDGAVGDLTETQLINAGDHAADAFKSLTAFPAADEYLYLVAGTGDLAASYSAGILRITLWGK